METDSSNIQRIKVFHHKVDVPYFFWIKKDVSCETPDIKIIYNVQIYAEGGT